MRMWRSLVFRLVALMLLCAGLGIAVIATIIHQATRTSFDAQRVNWQALAEQDPSAVQGELLQQFKQNGMPAACGFLGNAAQTELSMDIVLLDNAQSVICASQSYFQHAQVVFHESGAVRLFSDSAEVMAFDLEVQESLPLKDQAGDIQGWAMTVEAEPLLQGDEFAWRVWQDSAPWISLTLLLIAGLAAISLRKVIKPIDALTGASQKLRSGEIPDPLPCAGNTAELALLVDTFNAATQSLSETQQLREKLVSDIAHELRTPVTNIKGQLEALQLRLISNNDDFHDTVADEVLLLQRLISDFQDLALSDSGQLSVNMQLLPLLELLENTLLPLSHNCSLDFSLQVPQGILVQADEVRFRQVMHNLVENAKRAKPKNLHIDVTAETIDGYVEIEFSDNGPGISEQDVPHIFERFYRAEHSRNRATGGSGLGLAIVQNMMAAMQGSISYQENDKPGATFILRFRAPKHAEGNSAATS